MSYREENGQVVLTMSAQDYWELDACIKLVQVFEARSLPSMERRAALLRARLNEGNPDYQPYEYQVPQ